MINTRKRFTCWRCSALLAAASLAVFAPAVAAADPKLVAEIAAYSGPDRSQRLEQGAKKEGQLLTLYTSAPVDDVAVLTNAFEKKYGIKVRVWRSSSENILQRLVTEARAGRFEADIVETNGPEMEGLHREKLLQEVRSPYLGDLIPQAIPPHREWISTRINIFSLAYNTKAVKKEDLPKSYEDLLNPKWKGKLGIEAADEDWFAGVVGEMGEARGVKLFRDIVAANGISVRKGHTLLTQLVISGEVPLALTVYNYKADQLKNQGAPIDWMVIQPAIARPQGMGAARNAVHPHAALLFFDFMLSDAQLLLRKRDFVPTSKKVDSPLNKFPMKFIDPKVILDDDAKWTKLYQDVFTKQSR